MKLPCREALAGKGSGRWERATLGTALLMSIQQCEAAATMGTALWQQPTSPASCSDSSRDGHLALPDLITLFIVFMGSSQQGLGLFQGTTLLTAQMQGQGSKYLWARHGMLRSATGLGHLEEELNVGRRALWLSWRKYYEVLGWEIISNSLPQNICIWYIAEVHLNHASSCQDKANSDPKAVRVHWCCQAQAS